MSIQSMSLKPKTVKFEDVWPEVCSTLHAVINMKFVPRNVWNVRFSDIYALCIAYPEPLADELYSQIKEFLERHVNQLDLVNRSNKCVASQEQEHIGALLIEYHSCWTTYYMGAVYLDRLFLYLNTQHIRKQKLSEAEIIFGNFVIQDNHEKMEIGELALDIWKKNMILPLKNELVKLLLEAIEHERMSPIGVEAAHVQTTHLITDIIQSFVDVEKNKKTNNLSVYQELFEEPFLKASSDYYKIVASALLQECNVSTYMESVLKKMDDEGRIRRLVHATTLPKLRQKAQQHMISDHIEFLYSEIKEMVTLEKNTDLKNLYMLLHPIDNSTNILVNTLLDHIKNEGMRVVSSLKGESIHIQFVENLLDLHKKYKHMISEIFCDDQLFLGALDKACAWVINSRTGDRSPCRSPEMLSKYCDSLLKKSSKGMTEIEIDEKLTASITIFKYIDDKDVFQKFYSRMLAKRLIHQQSHNMDSEESMINRLKQACGYEFTNKLHRMFTDMSISSDLNMKFSNYTKKEKTELGINSYILVLQAGAWPLGPQVQTPFAVPQELEKALQMFENFYHDHFSGRKLTWLHHLCQGELKLTYLKKSYIITMQMFQMAILLLFENADADSFLFKDIQNTLQLNADTLQKHVSSLVDSKLLITQTEKLEADSVVSLNLEYSNKRTKFKITAALQRDSPQEVEQTMSAVEDDRKMYIQAAIVRIMKARKVLRHNALIQEILEQSKVSFAPNIAMIKKCIESLIDKQYIQRTKNSNDEYSYVA